MTAEVQSDLRSLLPPGSVLALYTDGLIGDGGDAAAGVQQLRAGLEPLHKIEVDLNEAAEELVRSIAPAPKNVPACGSPGGMKGASTIRTMAATMPTKATRGPQRDGLAADLLGR